MADKSIPREMPFSNFRIAIGKIKRHHSNLKTIKLLGGEPTLHSEFEKIVNYALKYFTFVRIFTNGLFSTKTSSFMEQKTPRVTFMFNIATPTFLYNDKARKIIEEYIYKFSILTNVDISLTLDPSFDVNTFFDKLTRTKFLTKISSMRLGVRNPEAKSKNLFGFKQFPIIGNKVISLIKNFKKINNNLLFILDCGFTKCMFTQNQWIFLKKMKCAKITSSGCLNNLDILTNLNVIPCYPLSQEYNLDLKRYSIKKIRANFIVRKYIYENEYSLNECKKCQYNISKKGTCLGPCYGFKMNSYFQNNNFKLE
ncbi:hypothetical protein A2159_02850 [Candidatus Woesebacteria bacterium RBG_13_34_9]|uniref:Radical SAM core domain-containing protein n=1 Tax=Candidatus Woesebacteria bacterium RBG_13_34_9 TaxID=1802477 RepID=A0A1F7X1V4_9BACT|nr:MAG: hypothetical protein A2159_02850 [Candidatus Woesebacteria bacterium RBG_13_34_9]